METLDLMNLIRQRSGTLLCPVQDARSYVNLEHVNNGKGRQLVMAWQVSELMPQMLCRSV